MSRYSPTVLPTTQDPYAFSDRMAQAIGYAMQEGERRKQQRLQDAVTVNTMHTAGLRQGKAPVVDAERSDRLARAFASSAGIGAAGAAGMAGSMAAAGKAAVDQRDKDRYTQLTPDWYRDARETPLAIEQRREEQTQRGLMGALGRIDPNGAGRIGWIPGFDYNPAVAEALAVGGRIRVADHESGNRVREAKVGSRLRINEIGVGHRNDMIRQDDDQDHEWGITRFREGRADSRAAASRAAAASANGISPGVKREYDYWQKVAADIVAAHGGDAQAAMNFANATSHPDLRAAIDRGDLTSAMFGAAAQREQSGGERMSADQAEALLKRDARFLALTPVQQRDVIERFRAGASDPYAAPSPRQPIPRKGPSVDPAARGPGPLTPEQAAEAHRNVSAMPISESVRQLREWGFDDDAIRQVLPGVPESILRRPR